jgi:anti-sigma regulatory factor (Ser/Thr protein kinase)
MTSRHPCVEERLRADVEVLCHARALVSDQAREAGFDAKVADDLANAANEAIANVIRHGYECRPGHWFELKIRTTADRFVIEILDEGKQVDPEAIRPPEGKDPLCPGGLGLAWIRQIMDNVEFQKRPERGMITRMSKRLPAARRETPRKEGAP